MPTKARFHSKMGPEVLFFFSQLMRHERVLKVFNMTNDTNYRMVIFSDEREI